MQGRLIIRTRVSMGPKRTAAAPGIEAGHYVTLASVHCQRSEAKEIARKFEENNPHLRGLTSCTFEVKEAIFVD